MPKRVEHKKEVFKRAISECIMEELELPCGMLATVVDVSIGKDLKNLRVFVSIYPANLRGSGLALLNKNKDVFREYLSENLFLRALPKIEFKIDATEDAVEEVENIFREIEGEGK